MHSIQAVVMMALLSVSAGACPTLAGNYLCTYRDGSTEAVVITQSTDKTGLVTYLYNGSHIVADGKSYTVPPDENLRNGTYRAWCDDNVTVKTELVGEYWNYSQPYGDLRMDVDFSLDGRNLKSVTNYVIKTAGGAMPVQTELTCTPN